MTDEFVPVTAFEQELCELLNRHSAEGGSDTPDFILAAYLISCLRNWNHHVYKREEWYRSTFELEKRIDALQADVHELQAGERY